MGVSPGFLTAFFDNSAFFGLAGLVATGLVATFFVSMLFTFLFEISSFFSISFIYHSRLTRLDSRNSFPVQTDRSQSTQGVLAPPTQPTLFPCARYACRRTCNIS